MNFSEAWLTNETNKPLLSVHLKELLRGMIFLVGRGYIWISRKQETFVSCYVLVVK